MVFINCTYCKEPLCVINYKLSISDQMVIRTYSDECSYCHKELNFIWHDNADQIFEEGKLDFDE